MSPRPLHAARGRIALELRRTRRSTAIVLAGMAVALASAGLLATRMNVSFPWTQDHTIQVAVDTADGVQAGQQEVRWAGVVVGRVRDVQLRDGRAVLVASIDTGKTDGRLYRDARLRLRPQTALQDMYLDVESRGHRSAGELRSDEVLPAQRTRTAVNVADVMNVFSDNVRDRLRQALDGLARGLPDGGAQLRSAFAATVPWLRTQARLAHTLAAQRGVVRRLVRNLRLLTGELAGRADLITALVERGGATTAAIGARRDELGRVVRELPSTLAHLHRSFTRVRGTLAVLRPAVAELRPAARSLRRGLASLRAFSATALPALRSLQPAVDALIPLADQLAPTARSLSSGLRTLAPQLPRVDRATARVVPCKRKVSKFFAWTLSVFKLGNKETRTASPRAALVVGPDALSQAAAPSQILRPIESCTRTAPAGGIR